MTAQAQRVIRASDIASLAGVSPAAVANWRDRHKDTFPTPTGGTTARPLYDYDEVVRWLRDNGKRVREVTSSDLLWSAMDSLRGVLEPESFGRFVLTLLVIRKLSFSNSTVQSLWGKARSGASSPRAAHLLDQLLHGARSAAPEASELLEGEWPRDELHGGHIRQLIDTVDSMAENDLPDAASAVLVRVTRSQARRGGESGAVGSATAQVLASLATRTNLVGAKSHAGLHSAMPEVLALLEPVSELTSVYDPACGISEALLTVHQAHPNAQLIGRERVRSVLTIAQQRAYLADIDADLAQANTFETDPWPAGRADAIVAEPPFGMRLTEKLADWDKRWQFGTPNGGASDFAWLQDAIAHLKQEGRAYVLQAGGPLFRGAHAGSIRRGLVSAGCVESVIALPSNLLTYTSVPLFVWVLRVPRTTAEAVKFIDASLEKDEIRAVDVSIADLLNEGANLTPRRWLADVALEDVDVAAEARRAEGALNRALDAAATRNGGTLPPIDFDGTRVLSLSDLLKFGSVCELRRGSVVPGEKGDTPTGVIRPSHLREGLPEHRPAPGIADPAKLTQPGDVLVTTRHSVQAAVDTVGGYAVSNQVWILAVNTNVLLPAYLAVALTGTWNNKFQVGTAIKHVNLKDLEIPVPSLEEQEQIVRAIAGAEMARRTALQVADAAVNFTEGLLNAVRYGADLTTG